MTNEISFSKAHKALEDTKEQLQNVPPNKVKFLNIPVMMAVHKGSQLYQAAMRDKDAFADTFIGSLLNEIKLLYTLCLAMWAAQTELDRLTKLEEKNKAELTLFAEQALEKRNFYLKAADFIWIKDKKVRKILADIRKGHGYLDRANDLMALADLFLSRLEEAMAETNITEQDIHNLSNMGIQLINLIHPETKESAATDMKLMRDQAYTLFFEKYEAIRRAAKYVFWMDEEKLQTDYPALHSMTPRSSKPEKDTDHDEPSVEIIE